MQAENWLVQQCTFTPGVDVESWALRFPSRWAVVLLADESGRPIQLLCVKDLRYCIRRRLGDVQDLPSRRVDYRSVVRHICWRRVDSALEADWIYYEVAREVFPKTYQGMVGFRPAWFVHVDPDAPFPRYTKTIDLSSPAGKFFGPFEDKHAAARLIELIEDAFDLCRYYHILVQAPQGRACAYKEMGKCPAPCDGSISLDMYHRLIDQSVQWLVNPGAILRNQGDRMQQAAGELRFELAGKIKAYVNQLSELGKGAFRYARRLEEFAFVSVQRGAVAHSAVIFLITPGNIEPLACLRETPARSSDLVRLILARVQELLQANCANSERIGIVSQHLFAARQTQGVFMPVGELTPEKLVTAYRQLQKQKSAEEAEGEGLTRELQAME